MCVNVGKVKARELKAYQDVGPKAKLVYGNYHELMSYLRNRRGTVKNLETF